MRRLVSWLHLWVGLVAGTLFAVLGLTGSVLVFHEDLLRWQHPQLEHHALQADGNVLAGILTRETPHGLRSVQFPDAAMPTIIGFYRDGRRGYFAPEDGRLLLMRSTDDDALLWLQDLHIHFLSGEVGEQVVGIVGWIALGLLLTGVYLWWPKRGLLKLSLSWFAHPPVRRWLSWHRSTGVLMLPLLLLLTLTGVGMVYHGGARTLLTGLFGGGDIPPAPELAATGAPDWPAVIARAQSGLPGAHLTRTAAPAPGAGVVGFRARMPGEWHVNGRSTVHVDLAGRHVLLAHDATALAAGARMTEAIYPLHIGAVGGTLVRWLTALAGLVPAFLLVTGLLFWWRRPARR
jgi:uncharacterized iron-regulated membrane protein